MQTINHLLTNPQFQQQVEHQIIQLPAKTQILQKDSLSRHFYVIKKGKVRIAIGALDQPASQIILGIDDSVGEYALFDNLPASADVFAETDVELIEIDIPSLRIFLEKNCELGYKLCLEFLRTLIKRLRTSNKTIASFYTDEK